MTASGSASLLGGSDSKKFLFSDFTSTEVLQKKIACGTDVNGVIVDDKGGRQRPLEIAIRYFNPEQCRLLLQAGAAPEWDVPPRKRTKGYRESALRQLLTKDSFDAREIASVAQLLLEAGANPDGTNALCLHPPMHLAAAHGYPEVIEMLIASGATLGARPDGQKPVVQEILEKITLHNENRRAAVSQAVVTLLRHGAECEFITDDGYTAFQEAVRKGLDPVVLYYASERGEDLAQRTSRGTTLMKLARHDSIKQILRSFRVQLAISSGIDAQNIEGQTVMVSKKGMAPL
jgi:ankyrin repeat protein